MLSPILACEDIGKAIAHYTDVLGFELRWAMTDDTDQPEFACVALGDAEVLLGVSEGFVNPEDMARRGLGVQIYISLPAEHRIDELYASARANGAIVTREIETRDWGERTFNVRDIDGYQLMIAQEVGKQS